MIRHYPTILKNGYFPKPHLKRITLFWMSLLFFLVAFRLSAQELSISGNITGTDNESLPGVNIIVKGTTRGTTSDADGNYRISVANGDATLVFSFIGFQTQEVAILNRTQIDIRLEIDAKELSEVVVTALGISQEKRALGYSVQEVRGDEIAQTQRPNFMASLQARVAGLSMTSTSGLPGSSTSITLRGVGSITGSNQPLIVVDGLPVDNRVFNQHNLVSDQDNRNNDYLNRAADVNPNDIASITILKGPEAAALYGQGGASGAILITTKRGTEGALKITYDNNFGFQKLYRFPETQNIYTRGNFGYDDPNTEETTYFGVKYADGAPIYDNVNSFFKTGTNVNHNLTVEGGSTLLTNRFSVNYYKADGVVPNNEYEKLSARLTSGAKLADKLELVSTFNYILSNNQKPFRGANGYLLGILSWPFYDDVNDHLNVDGTRRRLLPDVYTPSTATFYLEPDNPLFAIYKNTNTDRTNRVLSNVSLSYDPLKWLNITGRIGADVYSTQGNAFIHPESNAGINRTIPNTTGGPLPGGSIENYLENNRLLNGLLLGTVKKEFGKFKTTLMFGTSFDAKSYETTSVLGSRLQLKDFNSMNNTDLTTRNYKTIHTRQRLASLFGNLNIGYEDLVYLTVTSRNDWSSTLPPENNSYFYPSVALSFVLTELPAFENLSFLSFAKLRGSYAEVGKDADPYKVRAGLVSRSSTGGGFSYGFFGGNPGLKPERAEGFEIGTEVKLFNGRAGVDFAWYKNDRLNQISTQRLSYGTGFVLSLLNGGHVSVRGFEVQLTGTPLLQGDFEWNVTANFSKSVSKVIELPAEVKEYYNSDTWLYGGARGSAFPSNLQSFYAAQTYPYYNWDYLQRGLGSGTAIGGVTYERNANGDILINPANGLPVKTADYLPIGDRNPDFMIGLNNSFKYKNVNLSFLLDIRKGGDVFNANELYLFVNGLSTRTVNREEPVVIQGVLKDGLQNSDNPTVNTIELNPYTLGSTYYGAFAESDFVEHDINWLRLRDVTLAYLLPSDVVTRTKLIKTASVFVTATDLFMITNYTGADPMVNGTNPATNGSGAFGFDYGSLSVPRTISMGLRISL
jgi:TonB-linked SusC/RagA family outer membrane protein